MSPRSDLFSHHNAGNYKSTDAVKGMDCFEAINPLELMVGSVNSLPL